MFEKGTDKNDICPPICPPYQINNFPKNDIIHMVILVFQNNIYYQIVENNKKGGNR